MFLLPFFQNNMEFLKKMKAIAVSTQPNIATSLNCSATLQLYFNVSSTAGKTMVPKNTSISNFGTGTLSFTKIVEGDANNYIRFKAERSSDDRGFGDFFELEWCYYIGRKNDNILSLFCSLMLRAKKDTFILFSPNKAGYSYTTVSTGIIPVFDNVDSFHNYFFNRVNDYTSSTAKSHAEHFYTMKEKKENGYYSTTYYNYMKIDNPIFIKKGQCFLISEKSDDANSYTRIGFDVDGTTNANLAAIGKFYVNTRTDDALNTIKCLYIFD